MSLPQLVHLVRLRGTGHDVSGVSTLEYLVVITAQVAWTSYWLLNEQWLVGRHRTYGDADVIAGSIPCGAGVRAAERAYVADASERPHMPR